MIADETTINQNSKTVDVSNYGQPYDLDQLEKNPHTVYSVIKDLHM